LKSKPIAAPFARDQASPTLHFDLAAYTNQVELRACLAQLNFNFTSKAVILENSFMSDFLHEVELFWKKCLQNSFTNYFMHS